MRQGPLGPQEPHHTPLQNPRKGRNVVEVSSLMQPSFCLAGKLPGGWERTERVILMGISPCWTLISPFPLYRRPLPKATVLNRDRSWPAPRPELLPDPGLCWKRDHRVDRRWEGRLAKQMHTLQVSSWCPHPRGHPTSCQLVPPRERTLPTRLEGTRLPVRVYALREVERAVGRGGVPHLCSEAWSMLPSCGHIRKCACSGALHSA